MLFIIEDLDIYMCIFQCLKNEKTSLIYYPENFLKIQFNQYFPNMVVFVLHITESRFLSKTRKFLLVSDKNNYHNNPLTI